MDLANGDAEEIGFTNGLALGTCAKRPLGLFSSARASVNEQV
ncbi:MAG: hypothetical protein AB8B87_06610 [Granulosicoccus sp.]